MLFIIQSFCFRVLRFLLWCYYSRNAILHFLLLITISCRQLIPFGTLLQTISPNGIVLKVISTWVCFRRKDMHAQSQPQWNWRVCCAVLDSPAPLAILPCMGSCQSNWRVPSRRAQARARFQGQAWQGEVCRGSLHAGTRHSHWQLAGELANPSGELRFEKKIAPIKHAQLQGAAPLLPLAFLLHHFRSLFAMHSFLLFLIRALCSW